MRKVVVNILLALFLFSCGGKEQFQPETIKVLQFNVWQEGTMVEGGFEGLVSQIIQSEADIVMLSEIRNYNNTRFCDRVVKALGDSGKVFYSFYSEDSGLLSRFPIQDSITVFPLKDDHGSVYKAVVDMNGQEIAIYTAHLDYLNCAYYDVYGYSGNTWEKLDKPLLDIDSILTMNTASMRDDGAKAIINKAKEDVEKGRLVFVGGDFNEPSHLDWTEETKGIHNHQGIVIPWTVSGLFADAGFKDAYREVYPDPATHPGFTFPAQNNDVDIQKLLWAADSDERERIDFIMYMPDQRLKITDACIWGPQGSINAGKVFQENTRDVFKTGKGLWPTDHKAVLATFEFTRKKN